MRKAVVCCIAITFLGMPVYAAAPPIQNAFLRPYGELLQESADASALFASAEEVERALLAQPCTSREERLLKRIAAVRMLMADRQLRPDHTASWSLLKLSARQLAAAGEQAVRVAALRNQGRTCSTEWSGKDGNPAPTNDDHRCALGGGDSVFNIFDIVVMPVRLVLWILEKLFNIILFPFKLLAGVIF